MLAYTHATCNMSLLEHLKRYQCVVIFQFSTHILMVFLFGTFQHFIFILKLTAPAAPPHPQPPTANVSRSPPPPVSVCVNVLRARTNTAAAASCLSR